MNEMISARSFVAVIHSSSTKGGSMPASERRGGIVTRTRTKSEQHGYSREANVRRFEA